MNIIFAEVLGIVSTIVGLSLLVNRKGVPHLIIQVSDHEGLWWLYGCISLIFGSLILVFNDVGGSDLHLAVTIFAWLALLKGSFILIFPTASSSFYKSVCKPYAVMSGGIIIFILGLALLFSSGII